MDYLYEAFGCLLRSNVELHWLAPQSAKTGVPDLTLQCLPCAAMDPALREGTPLYESTYRMQDQPWMRFLRTSQGMVVHFYDDDAYLLTSTAMYVYTDEGGARAMMQSRLFSSVIAYWLEMRDVIMLHASVVQLPTGCVGFLADSGTGKSTLAAYCVSQGMPLVADDLLACTIDGDRVMAVPSFPSLRLWPDQALRMFGDIEGIETVTPHEPKLRMHAGLDSRVTYCATPTPLQRVYVIQRLEEPARDVQIASLTAGEAVVQLMQHSFVRRMTRAAGMLQSRLGRLAALAGAVPVRSLTYRSGYDNLPNVLCMIIEDGMNESMQVRKR